MATPEEIQRLLNELQAAYDRLGAINPFENFDASNIQSAEVTTRRLQAALDGVNSRLKETELDLDGIVGAFKASVNELSKTNTALGNTKSIFNSLTSLSQKLRYDQEGISKLSVKELKSIKEKILQKKIELKDNLSLLNYRKQELIAENKSSETSQTQKRKNREEIQRLNSAIAASNAEYKEQEGFSQELIKYAQDRLDLEEKIAGTLGVKTFGALSDIAKAIPGFSRFATPFQEAEEAARKQAESNEKLYGNVQGMSKKEYAAKVKQSEDLHNQNLSQLQKLAQLEEGKDKNKHLRVKELQKTEIGRQILEKTKGKGGASAAMVAKSMAKDLEVAGPEKVAKSMSPLEAGIKSIGKSLAKALGPLALLKGLVDAFLQSDKIVGDMAKGLNVSYSNALAMKQELTAAANESGNIFVTSKGMAESLMAINKTLGTNVMLNKENLATFTELREVAGFTNEELMGMQSLANATGGNLKDMTGEFMAQVKLTNIKNKVALNEKELMKEISNVSAATTLSFGKNPSLIAETVATVKALGMEMSKVEGIADSLLDFERSIENELQAELLLGKDINLEKARQAALNNDLKTVAEEVAKIAGSSADFAKMNRIQQQALAEAVGMSREDLAKSLFLQEQIGNVSEKEYNLKKEQIEKWEAEGLSQAKIKEKLANTSIEDLENQASMQDRFNTSVEKLKEVFVTVAEAVMPLMDVLSDVLKVVGLIVKGINYLATSFGGVIGIAGGLIPILMKASFISRAFAARGFMGAIAAIYRSFAAIPYGLGIPLAAGAVIGLSTLIKSATSKVGDLSYTAKGGKLKTSPMEGGLMGPRITTPDGKVFEGTKNDDILMAPGASKMLNPVQPNNNNIDQPITSPVNNIIKTPTPPPPVVMAAPTPAPTVDNEKTERAIGETNTLLKQILNKQGTVKMNTTDVGTSFSMNTFNVQ